MVNARGSVDFSIEETSALLPSMCRMLKFGGNSLNAKCRSPPSRKVAGSCGLMSLLVPTWALLPAGADRFAAEQPDSARAATSIRTAPRRAGLRSPTRRLITVARIRLWHRAEQSPRVIVLRIAQHVLAFPLLYDGTGVHHHDVVGQMLDDRKVVRHKQVRQAEPLLQIQQQVDDPGLNGDIQCGHRFVERQDPGSQRQRPGDTDALLLPAGELRGIARGIGAAKCHA